MSHLIDYLVSELVSEAERATAARNKPSLIGQAFYLTIWGLGIAGGAVAVAGLLIGLF